MLLNLHQGPQKLFTWGRERNLYIAIHCSCLWNREGVVPPFFTQRKLTIILWISSGRMASLCKIHPRGNCERNRKSKIQVTNLQANRPQFSQQIPAIVVLNLKRRIPPTHLHIGASSEEVQSQNHGSVLALALVWEMVPLRRTRQRILSWKDQLKLSQLWPLKSELYIPFIWLSRSPFKFCRSCAEFSLTQRQMRHLTAKVSFPILFVFIFWVLKDGTASLVAIFEEKGTGTTSEAKASFSPRGQVISAHIQCFWNNKFRLMNRSSLLYLTNRAIKSTLVELPI